MQRNLGQGVRRDRVFKNRALDLLLMGVVWDHTRLFL